VSAAVLIIAALLGDLCDAAPPAPPPATGTDAPAADDSARAAEESARYADVGDAERAAGHARTAAVAYRKALELDPGNHRARAALAELCLADAAALPPAPAPPDAADAAAGADEALGVGLARYRRGDLAGAARSFSRARSGAATCGAAHFFLGMIAYRQHDAATAMHELDLAGRDPRYAEVAAEVRRLAAQERTWVFSLLSQAEVDSNVELLPETPPAFSTAGTPVSDLNLLLLGAVALRPAAGLLLRESLFWRDQLELSSFDFLRERAEARYQLERGRHLASLRYDFDLDFLDGATYLYAHHLGLGYRLGAGERVALGAGLDLRRRDFPGAARADFNGFVESGELAASLQLGDRWDLGGSVNATREDSRDPVFASVAGGAALTLRLRLARGWRVAASLRGYASSYDAAQPDGLLRQDLHGEAELDAEVDLGDSWLLFVGADATRNGSTVEDFRYVKLAAHAGVAVSFGAP
jgi:hypothetical protein